MVQKVARFHEYHGHRWRCKNWPQCKELGEESPWIESYSPRKFHSTDCRNAHVKAHAKGIKTAIATLREKRAIKKLEKMERGEEYKAIARKLGLASLGDEELYIRGYTVQTTNDGRRLVKRGPHGWDSKTGQEIPLGEGYFDSWVEITPTRELEITETKSEARRE